MSTPVADRPAATEPLPPVVGEVPVPATGEKRSLVSVVVTYLPFALLGAALLCLALIAAVPLTNMDTYFHLRYGHEFLSGAWSLRHPGTVSTFGTAHWLPTQWLPEVVMAQLETWFGLAGVAWLAGVLFLTLGTTIFLTARASSGPWVSVLMLFVTVAGCTSGMSMRPQLLSYIFVVVVSAAWVRSRESGRAPWFLVPMTYLWTMCHGMWPIGILIGVVAVVGMAMDRSQPRAVLLRFLAVPVASAVSALLTPVGPGLFGAVLLVNSRGQYFSEWAAPDFTTFQCVALLGLLAAALVPRLRARETDWFSILLIGLSAAWAVYSLRTVPVAACLLVPFAASGLQSLAGASASPSRRERLLVGAGAVVAALGLALVVPGTSDQPPRQPSWEAGALGSLPVGTKVLDESVYGGYLMWRFPNLDVVEHGYGDAFTDRELKRNVDIERLNPGWEDLVRGTGVQYAVVNPRSMLGYALEHVEHWTVLHSDPKWVMLAPPPGWYAAG